MRRSLPGRCRAALAALGKPGRAGRRALEHLLGCPACARRPRGRGTTEETTYEALFAGLSAAEEGLFAQVEAERRAAEAALALLLPLSPRRRRALLAKRPELASDALAWRLLEQVERLPAGEGRESVALAHLALAVAAALPAAPRHQTIAARAWALVAEACRRRGRLAPARAAIARAGRALTAGYDPYEEAVVERAAGRLARAEGRREPAVAHLERGLGLLAAVALPEEGEQLAVELAVACLEALRPERALGVLGEVRPGGDRVAAWAVSRLRALALVLAGREGEAWPLLAARPVPPEAVAARWAESGWLAGLAAGAPGAGGAPPADLAGLVDAAREAVAADLAGAPAGRKGRAAAPLPAAPLPAALAAAAACLRGRARRASGASGERRRETAGRESAAQSRVATGRRRSEMSERDERSRRRRRGRKAPPATEPGVRQPAAAAGSAVPVTEPEEALSPAEIRQRLRGLSGWRLDARGPALSVGVSLASSPDALLFASLVDRATRLRRLPEPEIRLYAGRVSFRFSAARGGRLGSGHLEAAHAIGRLAAEWGAE